MKSAGAAKKGGTSPVTAVLDYPEYASEPGLNVQRTPGNDVECVTAQVGAGANVVLFTTGFGTPTGNPIAPVVKLSTNAENSRKHMHEKHIGIDTGKGVSGETYRRSRWERPSSSYVEFKWPAAKCKPQRRLKSPPAGLIPWRGTSRL